MNKTEYQSILNHCFAAYKGLNTAMEEYAKAVEEYWGGETATQLSEKFDELICETDCYQKIRDIIGELVAFYYCDQTDTPTD